MNITRRIRQLFLWGIPVIIIIAGYVYYHTEWLSLPRAMQANKEEIKVSHLLSIAECNMGEKLEIRAWQPFAYFAPMPTSDFGVCRPVISVMSSTDFGM